MAYMYNLKVIDRYTSGPEVNLLKQFSNCVSCETLVNIKDEQLQVYLVLCSMGRWVGQSTIFFGAGLPSLVTEGRVGNPLNIKAYGEWASTYRVRLLAWACISRDILLNIILLLYHYYLNG